MIDSFNCLTFLEIYLSSIKYEQRGKEQKKLSLTKKEKVSQVVLSKMQVIANSKFNKTSFFNNKIDCLNLLRKLQIE